MTNKTFAKWLKILDRSYLTEREIISLRSLLQGNETETPNQTLLFNKFSEHGPYDIEPSQIAKGLNWLRDQCFKLNGGLRKNCPLGDFERRIIDRQNFYGFELVDLIDVSDNSYRQYAPVYRTKAIDGSYFDYYYCHKGLIVVNRYSATLRAV